VWTCLSHTRFPEWQHTTLFFDMLPHHDGTTGLVFRHLGLVPDLECHSLCANGWDHYLASLAGHVAGGGGSPWRSPTWRPASA
jgi:hypothetical protein